jgi:hypothetical protein
MRIWHLLTTTAALCFVLAMARDDVGRVALVVFVMGLGEAAIGLAAIMTLFQTIGAIGSSRDLLELGKAVAATTAVLTAASIVMSLWFCCGAWIVMAATS